MHPELGTLEDFRRLVAAAEQHGIEIALDIAFQASPDHPYVREHRRMVPPPGWHDAYAENPPKKYQDIVNPIRLRGRGRAVEGATRRDRFGLTRA